jgi:ABC-2 type transport system permease protein
MKTFTMLLRREFWEHRVLWIAPVAIAAVMFLTMQIFAGYVHLGFGNAGFGDASPAGGTLPHSAAYELVVLATSTPFCIAAVILAVIYLLDCLYADRRDRSLLFWKSIPVADHTVVLSKLCVGLLLIPLGTWIIASVTTLALALSVALRHGLGFGGAASATPWGGTPGWHTLDWLRALAYSLYLTLAAVLWYAPYAGYLLLVSAWAKRAVFAWAFLPPILVSIMERILFHTDYFAHFTQRPLSELMQLMFSDLGHHDSWLSLGPGPSPGASVGPYHGLPLHADPGALLASPSLWAGLLFAALFVWGAIALRRRADA